MRKNIELLAPAGSIESLYAAVANGTDAVYMGGTKFSARAYASNFDDERLKEAVDYCHINGVKVYITINTLIKESEAIEVLEYVKFLYEIGVDALIIQDIGIAYTIKSIFKEMEIHASTQATIHNALGAKFLSDLGFKRIVLSRELSLNEIKKISEEDNIETEIFVHGALCVCYSGQCLMSSVIGGRSGNRGRCAQPCRLPYTLIDAINNKEKSGYLLSPKDMCTIEEISDILSTGTDSLKIEGRMKRPEYVAGVVSSYRKAIDEIEQNIRKINYKEEHKKLLKLFNREGFSRAYLYGNTGRDMIAYNNPKNAGIFIGKVEQTNAVLLEDSVSVGDGISIRDSGFTISKITLGKEEVTEARTGEKVTLYPIKYKKGDRLYKTADNKLLQELSKTYNNPYNRKNDMNIYAEFLVGKPIVLSAEYNGRKYTVTGEIVQEAKTKPMSKERIEDSLKKTGETPFEIISINFTSFEAGFIPVSSLNSVRRELLDEITAYEKNKYRRTFNCDDNFQEYYKAVISSVKSTPEELPKYIVCVSNEEQLRAAIDAGCENIAVETFKRNTNFKLNEKISQNLYLKIPNIIRQEFESVCDYINENLKIIKGIITSNLGIIERFKGLVYIIGDYKLNVFNKSTVKVLSEFMDVVPLSVELNKKEIYDIMKGHIWPVQMMIYGKTEVMVSEYCPVGSTYGDKSTKKSCSIPCEKGGFYLKDRKDEKFIIKNDKFCRSYIYNSVPMNLIPLRNEIEKMGVSSLRLDFVDEDYNETTSIINSFLRDELTSEETKYTKGHFKRGVE